MSGSLPAVLVRPSILSCCTLVVSGAAAAEVVGSSGGRSALVVFLASGTVGMLVKIGSVVEAVEDAGEVGDESALVALPELLEPREEPWPLLELSEEPLEELKPENNDLNQARMLLRSRAPVLLAAVGAGAAGWALAAGAPIRVLPDTATDVAIAAMVLVRVIFLALCWRMVHIVTTRKKKRLQM